MERYAQLIREAAAACLAGPGGCTVCSGRGDVSNPFGCFGECVCERFGGERCEQIIECQHCNGTGKEPQE